MLGVLLLKRGFVADYRDSAGVLYWDLEFCLDDIESLGFHLIFR